MRRRLTPTLAVLALIALLPLAAADEGDSLVARRAVGVGALSAASDSGDVVIRPHAGWSIDLDLRAAGGDLLVTDDVDVDFSEATLPPLYVALSQDRRYDDRPAGGRVHATATDTMGANSTVLVAAVPGTGHTVHVQHRGHFTVEGVGHEILEESHWVRDQSTDSDGRYYAYTARDVLAMGLDGSTTYRITGTFELYLWGITFDYSDENGTASYRTGFWRQPSPDYPWPVEEEHRAFATLRVVNGTLRVSTASGSTAIYDDTIGGATSGETDYDQATGVVPGEGGAYLVDGDVTVEDGEAVWTYDAAGGEVQTRFPHDATAVHGQAQFAAHDAGGNGNAVLLGVVGGVVVSGAAAATAPNAWSAVANAGSAHAPRGWRARRADGYRHMAYWLERHGLHRLAAMAADRAVRAQPDDWENWIMRGVYRRRAGRLRGSVKDHQMAHHLMEGAGSRADTAHNAFQAARSCALWNDVIGALDWLHAAVEADPALSEDLRTHPDFRSLHSEVGFLRLANLPAGVSADHRFLLRP